MKKIKDEAIISFKNYNHTEGLEFDHYWPKILLESFSLAKEGIKTTKTIIDAISGKTIVETVIDKIPDVMIKVFHKVKQIKK